ncbi:MAG TPA: succinylglutamate desuccinylase/aspartoacylase family protein [Thermoanaerobaculia bacterium]|nr:succinylglutamate desuccinylase/aspartoacylase family protein [Thermoanaerobaculia bacterium]
MDDPTHRGKSLELAGTAVAPGEIAEIRLKVSESYFAEPVTIPVTVVRGGPGPTLFVTATVHGDELNGVGILHDLLHDTRFASLRGTLIAVPIANVPGFLAQTRLLPDRRDLNRSFPGGRRGSLTSRLADTLFREVVRQSDFGIDLHTAGGERSNYPQVRADLSDPGTAELARAFGCPVIVDGAGPEKSLRRTAVAAGIPTIVYEAGSARRFERPYIDVGTAGIRNVLRHLGMLEGGAVEPPLSLTIRQTRWVRARAGGILDLAVQLGEPLRRGQTLSLNTDPFGHGRSRLRAPHGGLVLGLTQLPLVHPGDAVCHLAELEPEELAAWSEHWQRGGGRISS